MKTYLQPSPSKRPTIDDVVLNLQKVLGYKSIKVDKLTEESKVEEKKPETDSSGNQTSPPVVEAKDGQTEKSGSGGGPPPQAVSPPHHYWYSYPPLGPPSSDYYDSYPRQTLYLFHQMLSDENPNGCSVM